MFIVFFVFRESELSYLNDLDKKYSTLPMMNNLNRLCDDYNWEPPTYKFIKSYLNEDGFKRFTVECSLKEHRFQSMINELIKCVVKIEYYVYTTLIVFNPEQVTE